MTDDELRQACDDWWASVMKGYSSVRPIVREDLRNRLLAFARRMQAVGLREAENALRNDPDNLADWTDEARKVADKVADWCEAEAKKLEHV